MTKITGILIVLAMVGCGTTPTTPETVTITHYLPSGEVHTWTVPEADWSYGHGCISFTTSQGHRATIQGSVEVIRNHKR